YVYYDLVTHFRLYVVYDHDIRILRVLKSRSHNHHYSSSGGPLSNAMLRLLLVVGVCYAVPDPSFGQLNCGVASECSAGQICSAGSCQAAPTAYQVASCVILPPSVVLQDATVRLFALARNASGRAISFSNF